MDPSRPELEHLSLSYVWAKAVLWNRGMCLHMHLVQGLHLALHAGGQQRSFMLAVARFKLCQSSHLEEQHGIW